MKAENMEEQLPLDLKVRTKQFALRIIRLYTSLPKPQRRRLLVNRSCVRVHPLERNTVRHNVLVRRGFHQQG